MLLFCAGFVLGYVLATWQTSRSWSRTFDRVSAARADTSAAMLKGWAADLDDVRHATQSCPECSARVVRVVGKKREGTAVTAPGGEA